MKQVFVFSEWIYKFVLLNILWLVFFLVGLGIFGFMPATVAVYSIVRRWFIGERDVPIVSSFIQYYKAEFIRTNKVGLIFLFLFIILYLNFYYVDLNPEPLNNILFFLYCAMAFVVGVTFINVFPVLAHLELKTVGYIKAACALAFLHPIKMAMQLLWIFCYLLVLHQFLVLLPALGVSVLIYFLMRINFDTIQQYRQDYEVGS